LIRLRVNAAEGRMRGDITQSGVMRRGESLRRHAAVVAHAKLQSLPSNPSSAGEYAATFSRREKGSR